MTHPRLMATVLVLALALVQGTVPALSASEEEVEEARRVLEAEARERAAALADLDAAGTAYHDLEEELEQLTFRTGRLRSQISLYESRTRELRDLIRQRAVDSYINGHERDPVARLFSPEDVQQSIIAREVLAIAVESDSADLDNLAATTADLERLREQLAEDSERVATLRIEADAVLERMNALFDIAQVEYDAAQAALTDAERALAEQRRREEEERRRREEEQRQRDQIRAALGAPAEGVPSYVTPGFICPIAAPTWFTDSWGAPRSGGRTHKGTDISAAHRAPVVAVGDGVIRLSYGALGGNIIWLYADHGVNYFYAHLDAYADGMTDGRGVSRGDLIGYNGDTGNPAPGAYHVHFGIYPGGITAVNPYPTVAAACS